MPSKKEVIPPGHCANCREKIVGAGYPIGIKKTRKIICDECNRRAILSPPKYPVSDNVGGMKFRKGASLHEFD